MNIRTTYYLIEAFQFLSFITFINYIMSRLGFYGTPDKMFLHEYGFSPLIGELCSLVFLAVCLYLPIKQIGRKKTYPDFSYNIPLWIIFIIDMTGLLLLIVSIWLFMQYNINSLFVFVMIELIALSITLFAIHLKRVR